MFQLNGYASPVRSLWHDFKAAGINGSVDPELWGLVDAGYHATSRLLTEDVKTLFAVPSVMSTNKAALNFGNITLSIVGTDGEEMFLAASATAMTVSGTLVPDLNGIYVPVYTHNGRDLYTLNGVEQLPPEPPSLINTDNALIYCETDSKWVIQGADLVGIWVANQSSPSQPPSHPSSWSPDDNETGTVDVNSGPTVYVFSTPVSSITSARSSSTNTRQLKCVIWLISSGLTGRVSTSCSTATQ